jgi:hypothetical protein
MENTEATKKKTDETPINETDKHDNVEYDSIIAPITVTPRVNTQTDRNLVRNPFTMEKMKTQSYEVGTNIRNTIKSKKLKEHRRSLAEVKGYMITGVKETTDDEIPTLIDRNQDDEKETQSGDQMKIKSLKFDDNIEKTRP